MLVKTKTESLICLTAVAAMTLLACGEPSARVQIDLQGLADHAGQSNGRLDRLRVRISPDRAIEADPRSIEIEIEVSTDEPAFKLELAPGRWLFEMVGQEVVGSEPPNATYFGDLRVELRPHARANLAIPVFPAGTFAAPVWVAKNTKITDAVVNFIPRAPRDDQSEIYSATLSPDTNDDSAPAEVDAFTIERVLPTGDYDAYVDATADGTNYSPVVGQPIPILGAEPGELGIEQGVLIQWQVPFDIY